jgi:hemoglobin
MGTLYQQIGSEQLEKLVDSFYNLVFASEKIGPLFHDSDKELVKKKQFLFLTQFLGGPMIYSQEFGHPRMRMRHLTHKIDNGAKVEWLHCMKEAIETLEIEVDLKVELYNCFPKLAEHMVNRRDERD